MRGKTKSRALIAIIDSVTPIMARRIYSLFMDLIRGQIKSCIRQECTQQRNAMIHKTKNKNENAN